MEIDTTFITLFFHRYFSQGKMELEETLKLWKQKTHILRYFNDSDLPKSSDFLTRFYEGHN